MHYDFLQVIKILFKNTIKLLTDRQTYIQANRQKTLLNNHGQHKNMIYLQM